jgi:CheY-like chemotaxis protein
MPRPTLLVAEREPVQALSTRKLVLETAKFNVLTAHSTQEALDIFQLFSNVAMAVLAMDETIDCRRIASVVKESSRNIPVVALTPQQGQFCDFADHTLSSYEPDALLTLVRSMLGDPRNIDRKA